MNGHVIYTYCGIIGIIVDYFGFSWVLPTTAGHIIGIFVCKPWFKFVTHIFFMGGIPGWPPPI